mgnify:CR=1 FL=1
MPAPKSPRTPWHVLEPDAVLAESARNGVMTDLNTAHGTPGWNLGYAWDINSSGQITGVEGYTESTATGIIAAVNGVAAGTEVIRQVATEHAGRKIGEAANFVEWRERSKSFEYLGMVGPGRLNIVLNDQPFEVQGFFASADALAALGTQPQLGRLYTAAEDLEGAPRVRFDELVEALHVPALHQRQRTGRPLVVADGVVPVLEAQPGVRVA